MTEFSFKELPLHGALAITCFYHDDLRGSFIKNFEEEIYRKAGISFSVSESFVSVSKKNVIRGLHFQLSHPQSKLICILSGSAWDVIVDLRRGSSTYRQWLSVELRSDGQNAVYVPGGFAHGFVSLSDNTTMLYQCDGKYDKKTDTGIMYNDKELGIAWPINTCDAILSQRDLSLMSLKEFEVKSRRHKGYN